MINLQSATSLEEKLFKLFKNNFGISSILYLKEREPTHPNYRNLCKALELYCQHSASDKFKVLQQYPFLKKGMYMKKLIKANNYDYYNLGARID